MSVAWRGQTERGNMGTKWSEPSSESIGGLVVWMVIVAVGGFLYWFLSELMDKLLANPWPW